MGEMSDGGIYLPSSSWEGEKEAILKNEKAQAVQMVKVAGTMGTMKWQDPYPSPFLSLSDWELPRTMTEFFQWSRYFYKFDPLIAGAVNALSSFPVTEVYLEDPGDGTGQTSQTKSAYERMLQTIQIHRLLVQIGIDYYLYGNAFIFGQFNTSAQDTPLPPEEIQWARMMRLDPQKVTIDVDPLTQELTYKWEVPAALRRVMRDKKPLSTFEKIPNIIREAISKNKALILNRQNVYHFARPGESGDGSVWGTPITANVMKLIMYKNVLRQAQEAIAREHIVPFRLYYLQKTETYNPYANFNRVAQDFAEQLNRSTRDPNYKVVSPVPVDVIQLGGDGKALSVADEIEQLDAEILAGMGVPKEFIFGGVSYSGTSLSLRILENEFITYRLLLKDFLQNFVIRPMAIARGDWHEGQSDDQLIHARLADLKMQDDTQQKELMINLNAAGKVSDEHLYNAMGLDPEKMRAQLETEALNRVQLNAQVQAEQQRLNLHLQMLQLRDQIQLKRFQLLAQLDQETDPEIRRLEAALAQVNAQLAQEGGAGAGMPGEGVPATPPPGQMPGATHAAPPGSPPPVSAPPTGTSTPSHGVVGGPGPGVGPGTGLGGPGAAEVQKMASQIFKLPRREAGMALAKLAPALRQAVVRAMGELENQAHKGTDMRPMPEQRPPRRAGGQ